MKLRSDVPEKCELCRVNLNDCMSFGGGENLCFGCWESVKIKHRAQYGKLKMQEMGNLVVFGVLDELLGAMAKMGMMYLKMKIFL
jgi:hypothetical protein